MATAAMQSLLMGPTASERAAGIDTTLPAKLTLVSVRSNGRTASVELSGARTAATALDVSVRPVRAAQIVYTPTAIDGVDQVRYA